MKWIEYKHRLVPKLTSIFLILSIALSLKGNKVLLFPEPKSLKAFSFYKFYHICLGFYKFHFIGYLWFFCTRICWQFVDSFVIIITLYLRQVYFNNKANIKVLGCQGMSRDSWFFTVPLCVKSKFQKSYKDIEDEKFQKVIDYIEFLKTNPS